MFNRQPFNRGKFNISSVGSGSFSGEIDIGLGMSGALSVVRALQGGVDINITTPGTLTRTKSFVGDLNIIVDTESTTMIRQRTAQGDCFIDIELESEGFNLYGYEYIILNGLTLKPGDELRIDTGEMTVELNGQNVSNYFSDDSEFFLIEPGENIIVYENGVTNSSAEITILWKDAFL